MKRHIGRSFLCVLKKCTVYTAQSAISTVTGMSQLTVDPVLVLTVDPVLVLTVDPVLVLTVDPVLV